MIVVADASPLHYLILGDQIAPLERLYGSVLVPEAVAAELRAAGAPDSVRVWMLEPPSWVQAVSVSPDEAAAVAEWLDAGERAAIASCRANSRRSDPDRRCRRQGRGSAATVSSHRNLGRLRAGADEDLLDVRAVLTQLARTTFYTDQQLVQKLFAKWLGNANRD